MSLTIEGTKERIELAACAEMMCQSEPWITLGRDLNACREAMVGDYKEVYVARRNRELLGFIVLQMKGAFAGYIQSVCILPDAQGAGIGSSLIRFAEERIFKVSPNVFLMVPSFNENAAQLYFNMGYEKVGLLKNYSIDGHDEILLRKTIASWKSFSTLLN
jgi:[ribosomal protein S18]-alanine N-acetyltransferase